MTSLSGHMSFPYQAKECSDNLMSKFVTQNRRSLDGLSARAFFYHSWVYEQMGRMADVRR